MPLRGRERGQQVGAAERRRNAVLRLLCGAGRFHRLLGPAITRATGMPPAAALFVALMFSGWAVAITLSIPHLSVHDVVSLLPLLAFTAIAGRYNLGIYTSGSYVTMTMAANLAAGILHGPAGAMLSGTIAALSIWQKRPKLRAVLFNLGNISLSSAAGAWLFMLVTSAGPRAQPAIQAPAALISGMVIPFFETILLTCIITLTQQRPAHEVWVETFRWSVLYWMGSGLLGLGLALSYRSAGLTGLLAFTGPVLLLRYAMKQYLDHTTRSVQELHARNQALEQANREIQAMTARLQETYAGTLEALVAALDARDRETRGHSVRVSRLTMLLARELGVQEGTQEWLDMERGSLLHDIGKIGVADAILRKPGKLADDEWAEMRRHARIGYEMLKDIPFLAGAAEIVACHHERWDGKGYPRGLAGEQIPLGARIFALADAFDAMATDRPYRRARSYEECKAEIVRCAGTQFDPRVVEAFLRVYPRWVEFHRESLRRLGAEHSEVA
jgi:putative nucleotidyltransferase with HDIG domain